MQYKISRILILDETDNEVRDIRTGKYFVVSGEIDDNKDRKTSNALGKTILVNMISYCLCGNMTDKLKKLNGYKIVIELIKKENTKYKIERTIGDKNVIINDAIYKCDTAKDILEINRTELQHVIHTDSRKNVILDEPNKYELQNAALDIFGLDILKNVSNKIYELANEEDQVKNRIKECKNQVDYEKSTIIKNKISELENKLSQIQKYDSKSLFKENEELFQESKNLNKKRNELLSEKYELISREDTINTYLRDITNEPINILNFIKQVNKELGDFLAIKAENAIEYHKIMISERIELLKKEKDGIVAKLSAIDGNLNNINKKLEPINSAIKETDEIRKYINSQNKVINELESLKIENSNIVEIEKNKELLNEIKIEKLQELNKLARIDIETKKRQFAEYSSKFVKELYGDNVDSYFDIVFDNSNRRGNIKYPIQFKFKIPGDESEGIKNVRNIIIDLMMLKYSNKLSLMIWDSSAFNGIDPEQLIKIFDEINRIVNSTNKQVIVCINSFQIEKFYNDFKNKMSKNMLIISKQDLLLRKTFN